MLKMTLTKVRKTIRELTFDPRKPGPWKIIAEIEDPKYWEKRAIELIKEGNIQLAAQLLILAETYYAAIPTKEEPSRPREDNSG